MFTNASQVVSNTIEDNLSVMNMTANPISSKPGRFVPYEQYVWNADNFHFYGIGVAIPFGLIGNIFSIGIFLSSPILRRTTTGQYLVALAVSDTLFLVGQMLRWFSDFSVVDGEHYYLPASWGLHIFETSKTACTMSYFLRYGSGLCSVWITVAITLERLIAVAFPLKISRISTLRRSRIVIVVITIISFGLALFSFWHFDVEVDPKDNTMQCLFVDERRDAYAIWNNVTIKFGTIIIPGVFIAILTVIIIVMLNRARIKRRSQLIVSAHGQGKQRSHSGVSTETQLTLMLVAVCVATTALRAPYTIVYYFQNKRWVTEVDALTDTQIYVANKVANVFNVINYAINFILYCLSGGLFREQIRRLFCRENRTGGSCETHQISLETPTTPKLGYSTRLLKSTSKASSTSQTDNF